MAVNDIPRQLSKFEKKNWIYLLNIGETNTDLIDEAYRVFE